MAEEPNFNWKGEIGDKFALSNPSDVDGTNARFIRFNGVSATNCFTEICQVLEEKGKIID